VTVQLRLPVEPTLPDVLEAGVDPAVQRQALRRINADGV